MVAIGARATYENECFIFDVNAYKRYTSIDGDTTVDHHPVRDHAQDCRPIRLPRFLRNGFPCHALPCLPPPSSFAVLAASPASPPAPSVLPAARRPISRPSRRWCRRETRHPSQRRALARRAHRRHRQRRCRSARRMWRIAAACSPCPPACRTTRSDRPAAPADHAAADRRAAAPAGGAAPQDRRLRQGDLRRDRRYRKAQRHAAGCAACQARRPGRGAAHLDRPGAGADRLGPGAARRTGRPVPDRREADIADQQNQIKAQTGQPEYNLAEIFLSRSKIRRRPPRPSASPIP